jgi:hypothetical protein
MNPAPPEVTGELFYSVDTGVLPVNETYGPNNLERRDTGTLEPHRMTIRNARPIAGELSLDRNGFVLVDHPTQVANFFDKDRLPDAYFPELVALIQRVSGARRVHVFDYTLRSGDEAERAQQQVREPILLVHNDYTHASGPRRVQELLPDEADDLLAHRFAIIQVWRPIHRPALRNPLAVADARSVAAADLIVAERRFYFPDMRSDEAIVFKVYDSETDGRARFVPHTSFHDPTTPADAPPRQSIEARALAFFGPA